MFSKWTESCSFHMNQSVSGSIAKLHLNYLNWWIYWWTTKIPGGLLRYWCDLECPVVSSCRRHEDAISCDVPHRQTTSIMFKADTLCRCLLICWLLPATPIDMVTREGRWPRQELCSTHLLDRTKIRSSAEHWMHSNLGVFCYDRYMQDLNKGPRL